MSTVRDLLAEPGVEGVHSVEVLRLQPGDTVVIKLDHPATHDECEWMAGRLRELTGIADLRVVSMTANDEIQVLRKEGDA